MTLSANEIGWPDLLKLLHTLAHGREGTQEFIASELSFIEKSSLINNDAVTCAIYFNKLVNVIMTILQSKKFSPFGKYRVINYFKRIEFQHRGSPHAHILLWLDNAPDDILGKDQDQAIEMIDSLVSVSSAEASGNIKLITHKHTFTCYKKVTANSRQKCRFDAPFMPCKFTMILTPMEKTDPNFKEYSKRYAEIRMNLESNEYSSFDDYYESNNIRSDEEYKNIIRSGIIRPRIFYKRHPSEKLHNTFNPFVFNVLKSNMDFQIITEEYSCAAYVVEYVNKTNRGISNLQRNIIEVMNEHPEFDIVEITRKMSVDMLNSVEMTSQEAAWYLLREPMSRSSVVVQYINTCWPIERQRIKKTLKQISELDDDSTDIWMEDWYEKYQKRPDDLENVTLAQFVSKYTKNNRGVYVERKQPRIIRYRNYDMAQDYNEYRREMVTLHLPFRNEDTEILADMKFITIYDENENTILQRRKEFESNIDIQKTIDICRQLCRQDDQLNDDELEIQDVATRFPEPNPFQELYRNPNAAVNEDLRIATLKSLGAIAKRRENIMNLDQFCDLMRSANEKQKNLLLHVIHHILSAEKSPLQIFFTGPAGCGKTFVIKLIMEIYNRFSNNDGFCNAYITCASTGKAAVAIDGTTVHTALKISLSKLLPLSMETAQQYRCLFKYVKVLIVDEISMIGAELLNQIDSRLKQITGNFDSNFGGLDIILIGDLRQLPPVRATPIYKQPKQRMVGPLLWRGLKFYELTQVMRQTNVIFVSILTKIGNGSILDDDELAIIESRFFTKEEVTQRCPNGVRLFHENASVNEYNVSILQQAQDKFVSIAIDIISGCANHEQEVFVRQKLHKMSVIDTGGLPYEIIFVIGKPYIVTTNLDVTDGLANGAVGTLVHIEQNEQNEITRVWLVFPDKRTGTVARKKAAGFITEHNIDKRAVPITRRTTSIHLNNNKTIVGKRNHFPMIPGCAMTIHKSQGGTYDEIVYEYSKTHSIQLLYVALSRVTSIEGLFICNRNDDLRFYHGRRIDQSILSLQEEFKRLSLNRLNTLQEIITNFIISREGLTILTLNCQSLKKHGSDLQDSISQKSNFLLLSETWLSNEEDVQLPNFDCIVKFKRENVRAAGVAIYQNKNIARITTLNIELTIRNAGELNVTQAAIGDICASQVKMDDGREFLMVVVYISPNQKVTEIIKFLHRRLLIYSREGSRILGDNLDELPMILAGDFNVNFATNDSIPLTTFLEQKFDLKINNKPTEPTTRYGTTIDAVFSRYLDNITSNTFVTYFSYHRPIISLMPSNTPSTATITEITEDTSNNIP